MKLLDRVRDKLRFLHYSWDTEQCYVRRIERDIVFHKQATVWRHGRSSVGFGLAESTRIPEVKKSKAIRRKSTFARCREVS